MFFGAGLLEVGLNPILGRLSDRRGRLGLDPRRARRARQRSSLAARRSSGSTAALTSVYIVAALAFGSFYTPGMSLGSARAARAGLAQGLAFGTMNSAWAAGRAGRPLGGRTARRPRRRPSAWIAASVICILTLARDRADARSAGGRTA